MNENRLVFLLINFLNMPDSRLEAPILFDASIFTGIHAALEQVAMAVMDGCTFF